MRKIFKINSIIIFSFLAFICNAQKSNKQLKTERIEIVLDVVNNVVKDFNLRNEILKKFNFDTSNKKESNLIILDSIKMLSIEIQRKSKDGLSILRNEFNIDKKEDIFNTGIKYLESFEKLEIVIPILIDHMHKLTSNEEANNEEMEKVFIALRDYEESRILYMKEMEEFITKNNLH